MSNDLGLDRSGNGNNWTVNNLAYSDQMVDSPTNNFATWNPIGGENSLEISEGNLKTINVFGGSTGWNNAPASTFKIPKTGKWYFEFVPLAGTNMWAGLSTPANSGGAGILGWQVAIYDQQIYLEGTGYVQTGLPTIADGSVVSYSLDRTAQTVQIKVNNVNYGTSVDISTLTAFLSDNIVVRLASGSSSVACSFVSNFGQDSSFAGNKTAQGNQDANDIGDFYYTPPTGFLALCTKNLPDVAVVPRNHFNSIIWTGASDADLALTGVGFQPDFVWIKKRTGAEQGFLWDSVRGVAKHLSDNLTAAEVANYSYGHLSSFDTDGFTTDHGGDQNTFGYPNNGFVAWNWKANGSGSSNTNGSITSTVSANVDAGFSIVSYTGNGVDGATIGHGLSSAPEMVIVKCRSAVKSWPVLMSGLVGTGNDTLYLNKTNAISSQTVVFPATLPTSSVFSVGTHQESNGSSDTYIAYCFHSVDGYSKVGSYTGNGVVDGTFVYTGFRPAFVLTKVTNAVDDWSIADSSRSPDNVAGESLRPNSNSAEDSAADIDILSNGFKVRQADSHRINFSGDTFIYIAFAETPFKYSNAR